MTHDVAPHCLLALRAGLVQETSTVMIDGQRLQHFDSSALAVLLELRRECTKSGQVFAVQNLPQRLQDLAALYEIDTLLQAA
jgi:phospholipid transport system transporter-binding protein